MKKNTLQIAFVDETGTSRDPNQPVFGVGTLLIHKRHLLINQLLRNVFLKTVHDFQAVEERFEFKFKYITKRSFPYYHKLLKVLEKFRSDWSFRYAVSQEPKYHIWELYLELFEKLFTNEKSRYIILADHFNKPKRAERGLSDIAESSLGIATIIQLESQGSALLQMADVILGALVYLQRDGQDEYKKQVAQAVKKLLQKTGAGVDPIYAAPNRYNNTKKK